MADTDLVILRLCSGGKIKPNLIRVAWSVNGTLIVSRAILYLAVVDENALI
jgi:hypothetical protein